MHHQSPGVAARRKARREKNEKYEVLVIDDDNDSVFKKPQSDEVIVLDSDDENDAHAANLNGGGSGTLGRKSVCNGSGSMRLQGLIPPSVKKEDDEDKVGVDGESSAAERHGGAAHGGAAQNPACVLDEDEDGAALGGVGGAVSSVQHSSSGKRPRSEWGDADQDGAVCSHSHKEPKTADPLLPSSEGGCSGWSHSAAGAASGGAAKEARAVDPSPAVNSDGMVQCQRCAPRRPAPCTNPASSLTDTLLPSGAPRLWMRPARCFSRVRTAPASPVSS